MEGVQKMFSRKLLGLKGENAKDFFYYSEWPIVAPLATIFSIYILEYQSWRVYTSAPNFSKGSGQGSFFFFGGGRPPLKPPLQMCVM